MKKLYSIILALTVFCFALSPLLAQLKPQTISLATGMRFDENKGQEANTEGEVQLDILYTLKDKGTIVHCRKDGISFQWYYQEEHLENPYPINDGTATPQSIDDLSRSHDPTNDCI